MINYWNLPWVHSLHPKVARVVSVIFFILLSFALITAEFALFHLENDAFVAAIVILVTLLADAFVSLILFSFLKKTRQELKAETIVKINKEIKQKKKKTV